MRAGALTVLMLVLLPAFAHAAVSCNMVPGTDISFGTYSGNEITTTAQLQITCTGGVGSSTLSVGITYGNTAANFPNASANRQMQSGNNRLNYQIYQDSTRATIWGDGTGGTTRLSVPITYVGGTATTTVPVFAVLLAGALQPSPLPPAGGYNDAVTVSITGQPSTTAYHPSATVAAICFISAPTLAFGAYSGVLLNGTTTLSATCTSGTPFNIGLNQGVASGATVTTRKMAGPGSQLLAYSLFRDSARTLNWGNTVGTDTVAATATGSAQSFTVFGRIPASQTSAPGSYQDTITATVTF
jgi:spore coat protein U-like protein